MPESYRVRLSVEAQRDLRQTIDWYDRQQPGLGQRFVVGFLVTLDQVSTRPGSFAQVYLDVRRAIFKRFPYGVFFRLVGEDVRVVAIMHLHRDPAAWRRRA